MPIEQEPTVEQETTPANVQTVSDDELETLRKHKGHHGHHGHDGHDGDDDCDDDGDDPVDPAPVTPEDKHAAIEVLAYQIWQTHMGNGRDVEDWLSAERLINAGILDISSIE